MKSVVKCFVRVLAVVCLGLLVGHAETVTWTNTAGGAWSLAANWSPNKVPVAADTAQTAPEDRGKDGDEGDAGDSDAGQADDSSGGTRNNAKPSDQRRYSRSSGWTSSGLP
jgi:hypothetical protein